MDKPAMLLSNFTSHERVLGFDQRLKFEVSMQGSYLFL